MALSRLRQLKRQNRRSLAMRRNVLAALLLSTLFATPSFAAGSPTRTATHSGTKKPRKSKKSSSTAGREHIKRSEAAKHDFMRQTGYPHGRPGYVVDHIVPLACGGADVPSNMQWQTVAEAKAKDRVERTGCR